jgi:hypothetical protein
MFAGALLSASIVASGYRTSSGCAQDSCHKPPRSLKVACAAILRAIVHRRALLGIAELRRIERMHPARSGSNSSVAANLNAHSSASVLNSRPFKRRRGAPVSCQDPPLRRRKCGKLVAESTHSASPCIPPEKSPRSPPPLAKGKAEGSGGQRPGKPETVVTVAPRGSILITAGRPQVLRTIGPRPPAKNATAAIAKVCRADPSDGMR